METITSLIRLTTCKESYSNPTLKLFLFVRKEKKRAKCSNDVFWVCVCVIRYLLNPKMEVVRCFGVEYNPDELSREVLKEVTSVSQ